MKTLKESLFDKDLTSKDVYAYHPKTRRELRSIIEKEIEKQGPDANLNIIDVSEITNMTGLFGNLNIENIDISLWDVSKVTNMMDMFINCDKFNCNLSEWNVSNVINMEDMFYDCSNFTGDGLDKWNVSRCRDFSHMFQNCFSLNCNFGSWDMKNARLTDFMFKACTSFEGKGLEKWNVENIDNMNYMFYNCRNFNCNLSNWDVSKVTDMYCMFNECTSFEGKGLEKWKPRNIIRMNRMFGQCKNLKCDLDSWEPYIINRQNIPYFDIAFMFEGCKSLKKIPDWYKELQK